MIVRELGQRARPLWLKISHQISGEIDSHFTQGFYCHSAYMYHIFRSIIFFFMRYLLCFKTKHHHHPLSSIILVRSDCSTFSKNGVWIIYWGLADKLISDFAFYCCSAMYSSLYDKSVNNVINKQINQSINQSP